MRQRAGTAYGWLNRHPFMTVLVIVTLVASAGYFRLEQIARGSTDAADAANAAADQAAELALCAQDYVKRTNEANAPVRDANTLLNAADDTVWAAANVIFTQRATQADYDALRDAVHARKLLSDHLKRVKLRHPPPPPPETFCAVDEDGNVIAPKIEPQAYSTSLARVAAPIVLLPVVDDGCATHAEWGGLEAFMRTSTVADLLGTAGVPRRQTDTWFSRTYDVCWDVAKVGVVRFDQQSGLSISWTVKDR